MSWDKPTKSSEAFKYRDFKPLSAKELVERASKDKPRKKTGPKIDNFLMINGKEIY